MLDTIKRLENVLRADNAWPAFVAGDVAKSRPVDFRGGFGKAGYVCHGIDALGCNVPGLALVLFIHWAHDEQWNVLIAIVSFKHVHDEGVVVIVRWCVP